MFRARVVRVFSVSSRRGLVLEVEIEAGAVRAGDSFELLTAKGPRTLVIRSVEFVDHLEAGHPVGNCALVVEGLASEEVAPGDFCRPVPDA